MGKVPSVLIGHIILDLITFALLLIGLPLCLIFLSPLYLWRLTVKLLAKILAKNRLDVMLSDLDCFFLFNDHSLDRYPRSVITILLTLEGEINFEEFKTNVIHDIVNLRHVTGELIYRRLQQRPVTWLGFSFFEWIPDFDASKHIRMDETGLKGSDESKYDWIASRLRNPFPKDGPLWEVIFLPASPNRTFLNVRLHHVLGDGYSILKTIMIRGMKINPNEFSLPTKCSFRNDESCGKRIIKLYRNTVGMPGKYLRENRIMRPSKLFREYRHLETASHVLVTSTHKIPLYKFKRTKVRLGYSFRGIVNCALGKALRRSFPKEFENINESLNGISFIPRPRHPNDAILNWCDINIMKIPLKSDEVLYRRLHTTNAHFHSTNTNNVSSYSTAQFYILKGATCLPISLAKALIGNKMSGFLYSNIPGPTAPGHLWNNFMSDVMIWESPSLSHGGISFSILSYNEYVKIGITVDSNLFRETDKLITFVESLEIELEVIFNLEVV